MSVDDDSAPASTGVRCGACGARNSGGAAWCSLCFSALAVPAAPEPGPVAEPAAEPEADVAGVLVPDGAPSVPRHAAEPAEEQLDEAEVTAMLAQLSAAERPAPRWSAVSGLVGSPGARVAVMLAGTVVVAAAGFGLLAALGALL
jgi:hypothetical protein